MVAVCPDKVLAAQATARHGGLVAATAVIFLNGMGFGGCLGYSGLVLSHHTNPTSPLLTLSEDNATWFNSVTPAGMMLGVLASIPASEQLGRKRLFLLGNAIILLSFLALHLAPSFPVLLVARMVQCSGFGLGAMTTGVYLSEIAIVQLRGPLIGLSQTSFCLGLLLYTAISSVLPIQLLGLVLAGHSLLVFMLALALPASPQWLVRHGREEEALASLRRLRGRDYPGLIVEMEEIKQCVEERGALAQASFCQALAARSFNAPLATFAVVFFLLGICGNDTMIFYGPTVFSSLDTGLPRALLPVLPWIGFSVGYALSSPLMARLGRFEQLSPNTPFQDESCDPIGRLLVHHVPVNVLPWLCPAAAGARAQAPLAPAGRPGRLPAGRHHGLRARGGRHPLHHGGGGLHPGAQDPRLLHGPGGQVRIVITTQVLFHFQECYGVPPCQGHSVCDLQAGPPHPVPVPRSRLCSGIALRLVPGPGDQGEDS
jgi:MFS family permease